MKKIPSVILLLVIIKYLYQGIFTHFDADNVMIKKDAWMPSKRVQVDVDFFFLFAHSSSSSLAFYLAPKSYDYVKQMRR